MGTVFQPENPKNAAANDVDDDKSVVTIASDAHPIGDTEREMGNDVAKTETVPANQEAAGNPKENKVETKTVDEGGDAKESQEESKGKKKTPAKRPRKRYTRKK